MNVILTQDTPVSSDRERDTEREREREICSAIVCQVNRNLGWVGSGRRLRPARVKTKRNETLKSAVWAADVGKRN